MHYHTNPSSHTQCSFETFALNPHSVLGIGTAPAGPKQHITAAAATAAAARIIAATHTRASRGLCDLFRAHALFLLRAHCHAARSTQRRLAAQARFYASASPETVRSGPSNQQTAHVKLNGIEHNREELRDTRTPVTLQHQGKRAASLTVSNQSQPPCDKFSFD